MFDYSALKKIPSQAEWFGESISGVDLRVPGSAESPSAEAVATVQDLMHAWDEVQSKAIVLADSFMKDAGDWHVVGLDLVEAKRSGFDYAIDLYFDPTNGTDTYGYTRFTVYFRSHADQPGPTQNHPSKLVIEFV
jgi:hypothetical protein